MAMIMLGLSMDTSILASEQSIMNINLLIQEPSQPMIMFSPIQLL